MLWTQNVWGGLTARKTIQYLQNVSILLRINLFPAICAPVSLISANDCFTWPKTLSIGRASTFCPLNCYKRAFRVSHVLRWSICQPLLAAVNKEHFYLFIFKYQWKNGYLNNSSMWNGVWNTSCRLTISIRIPKKGINVVGRKHIYIYVWWILVELLIIWLKVVLCLGFSIVYPYYLSNSGTIHRLILLASM